MRLVRIASIAIDKSGPSSRQVEEALEAIRLVAAERPDLVLLPEYAINDVHEVEMVPGPTTNAMCEVANRIASHVIVPLIRRDPQGQLFNSAVVINPSGRVIGVYDKTNPTESELRDGIRPGAAFPVFDTTFGRIGIAICFDLNFRSVIEGLVRGGAELICFPSAYEGGRQLNHWALEHGVFIASAHKRGRSVFVDNLGHTLERGDPEYARVICRELNLDSLVFHLDNNWAKLNAVRQRYGSVMKITVDRAEARFAIESRTFELSVDEIRREFEMETFAEYLQRSSKIRDEELRSEMEQE